jgi:hypothetical protein
MVCRILIVVPGCCIGCLGMVRWHCYRSLLWLYCLFLVVVLLVLTVVPARETRHRDTERIRS